MGVGESSIDKKRNQTTLVGCFVVHVSTGNFHYLHQQLAFALPHQKLGLGWLFCLGIDNR